MKIIIDFNNPPTSTKMVILEKRHIIGVAAAIALLLLIIVFQSAKAIASYWVQTDSPIVTEIAKNEIKKSNERRNLLWQDNVDTLLTEIADLHSNIIALRQNGIALANYMGLSGELLFTPPKEPTHFNKLSHSSAPETKSADITDWLYQQTAVADTIEKNYQILNYYGINNAIQSKTIPIENPVLGQSWTSSRYGYRRDPFTNRKAFHSGNDYSAKRGTPIVAGASGFVIYAGRLGRYGNVIQIYHGDGISTLYGHLHKIGTKKWAYVNNGDVIGQVGSTGRSTGPHLHYEVRVDNRAKSVTRTINNLKKTRYISQDKKV